MNRPLERFHRLYRCHDVSVRSFVTGWPREHCTICAQTVTATGGMDLSQHIGDDQTSPVPKSYRPVTAS